MVRNCLLIIRMGKPAITKNGRVKKPKLKELLPPKQYK